MSTSPWSAPLESRVERALLWFLRLLLLLLVLGALLGGEFAEALVLLALLAAHTAAYLLVPRLSAVRWQRWTRILVDIVSAGVAFYMSGDLADQGSILSLTVMALVATRLDLWPALVTNGGVWILFTWPLVYSWLWLGEPFSPRILTSLILWPAVTWGIHHLISREPRQMRQDSQQHLREVAGLHQLAQAVGSLTDIHRIHGQIAERIAQLMEVEMCGILAYSEEEEALLGRPPFFGVPDEIAALYRLPVPRGTRAWELWQQQDYLVLNHVQDEPLAGELGLQGREWSADLRDVALAAMVIGRRGIGAIQVANKVDGTPFSQDDARLLSVFASLAATLVENARLFETQQRQLRELGILYETSAAISSSLELREVLSTVARHMAYALEVSSCTISDWDPARNAVTTVVAEAIIPDEAAVLSTRDTGISYPLAGYPATAWVLQERKPLVIQVSDPEADAAERALMATMGQESALLMPLLTRDRVVGLLELYESRQPRQFSAEDIRLCQALANQAAVAIENAQLYQQTDKRLQDRVVELTTLQRTMQELNATLELDRILHLLLESAVQTVGATHGNVMLMDLESGQFALRAARGYVAAEETAIAERLLDLDEDDVIYQVAQSRQARIVDDTTQEPAVRCVRDDTRSALVVPIFYEDVVVGLINLRQTRVGAFDQAGLTFVQALAEQAAIAIGNAMRFEEQVRLNTALRQRTEQMDGLLAVSQKLRTDVSLEDVLEEVAYAIQETVGFDLVLISVVEDLQCEVPMLHRVAAAGLPLEVFEEARQVRQPVERYGRILTEEYRCGPCYFFPFQREEEWGAELHTLFPMPETEEEWREDQWHPRDMLLAPMWGAGGRLLGHVSVDQPRDGLRPSQRTLEVLSIFANQAATAYQNASLFQERQQRIEQLNVLNQMAQAISATLELDELLEVVYQQTSRLVDTTNFFIALYDEEKEQITFPFVVDPEQREDWHPRPKGEGLTGTIIDTGEALLLPTGAAGFYRDSGREIQAGLCRSWLGVPMIAKDRVLGVIAVQDYERQYVYAEEHLNLLSTVAAQAAVAVRNAQLYQQIVGFSSELESMIEARTRDLEGALADLTIERDRVETLYRITRELGATLDLDRVLQRALQLFADVLGVTHGTILLVDPETAELKLRATLEPGRRLPLGGEATPWRPGEGLAGWVLEHRQTALVPDISLDPRWVHRPDKEPELRSAVAAPLSLGGGDVLGVLLLGHEQTGYFGEEHLRLVTAATAQIAISVNNSDLYAFITDQADQLGTALQSQQEEAAKNRAILESIADGVLVLDHNGRVLLVNPAAEELLGFAGMALEGEHFRHMLGLGETSVHRELAQALYSELRRRLEEDTPFMPDATVRLQAANRALAVHLAPLVVSIGGAPGLVAALRDISREAEVERLKNEFISTVSHELRTPMTSIKGYTDLLFLGMAGGLTDAQRSFLRIIKSNADRLTALVNDILDISRIETGRMHLNIEALDLGELISQVVESFREQYREKGLTLEWEESEGLPLVRGDAARVTQVLSNLIANAWRYTPEGGQTAIAAQPVDGFLQVDIADTGIGISSDEVGRIFDRFYRSDHPIVQEAEGTGLGLSIVKMFVEMLGGEIWVESRLGAGSTFSFTLPLASTKLPEPVPTLLSPELAAGISRRSKILVVEDDRDLALLLRRQLETEGYQVLLAGTGEDALWLARESQPQLITLDIMLPDLDGFVVLERLKRNPLTSAIPVVVVSVLTDTEKGYALGAVDYVVKPFDEQALVDTVHKALQFVEQAKPQTLLVADDDLGVLNQVEKALSLHGYEVWTASDGKEALARVGESRPDLILLDIKMPGMDGYEVIRRLKSDEVTRPIPIIVITDSPLDKEQDRVRILGAEVREYLTKPLSVEMLIRGIKRAMMGKVAN